MLSNDLSTKEIFDFPLDCIISVLVEKDRGFFFVNFLTQSYFIIMEDFPDFATFFHLDSIESYAIICKKHM